MHKYVWIYICVCACVRLMKCEHLYVCDGEPLTLTLQIYPVVTTTAPQATTTTTGRMHHTCLHAYVYGYVRMNVWFCMYDRLCMYGHARMDMHAWLFGYVCVYVYMYE